jgi:hypothetical protein
MLFANVLKASSQAHPSMLLTAAMLVAVGTLFGMLAIASAEDTAEGEKVLQHVVLPSFKDSSSSRRTVFWGSIAVISRQWKVKTPAKPQLCEGSWICPVGEEGLEPPTLSV